MAGPGNYDDGEVVWNSGKGLDETPKDGDSDSIGKAPQLQDQPGKPLMMQEEPVMVGGPEMPDTKTNVNLPNEEDNLILTSDDTPVKDDDSSNQRVEQDLSLEHQPLEPLMMQQEPVPKLKKSRSKRSSFPGGILPPPDYLNPEEEVDVTAQYANMTLPTVDEVVEELLDAVTLKLMGLATQIEMGEIMQEVKIQTFQRD